MFKIHIAYKPVAVSLLVLAFSFMFSTSAHAATIDVAAVDDETTVNTNCSLSEAITNINAGDATAYPECTGIGMFGTDDTITIPTGTITLTDNLPVITTPVFIQGAGMGQTKIDGDSGSYVTFVSSAADLTVENLSITGFRNHAVRLFGTSNELTVSNLEIDGTGAQTSNVALMGIFAATSTVDIENIHIHNLNGDGLPFGVVGVSIQTVQGRVVDASISNVTIQNITSQDSHATGISAVTGLLDNSLTQGTINLSVQNTTIDYLDGGTAGAVGIHASMLVSGGDSEINIAALNNTITGLVGGSGGIFGSGGGIVLGSGALGAEDTAVATFAGTNNIIDAAAGSCTVIADVAPLFGAGTTGGVVTNSLTSGGGNLSSDDTCSLYFTQPTDQNNLTDLASTLSPLADNGGFVPTRALIQGSPAIDSGVAVSGLTTDARLAVRPQGTAYDSGAYESPYSKPAAASLASTGQNTALYALVSLTMLTLATSFISFKQRYSN